MLDSRREAHHKQLLQKKKKDKNGKYLQWVMPTWDNEHRTVFYHTFWNITPIKELKDGLS